MSSPLTLEWLIANAVDVLPWARGDLEIFEQISRDTDRVIAALERPPSGLVAARELLDDAFDLDEDDDVGRDEAAREILAALRPISTEGAR